MNKKGFVLSETLVVTIFVLLIFTVLYNSAVPLLGRYEELSYYDDLDATYDLYHIRKLVLNDDNYEAIVNNDYIVLGCSNGTIADENTCNNLFQTLNIDSLDEVIYIKNGQLDKVVNDDNISITVRDYLKSADINSNILVLQNDGYVSYLNINLANSPIIDVSTSSVKYLTGYRVNTKILVSCSYESSIDTFTTLINGKSAGVSQTATTNLNTREITFTNAGVYNLVAVCKGLNGKESTRTYQYTIFEED